MNRIRVKGGTPLVGQIRIQGSKNAVLPMMAATVLHRGTTVLENCPDITDVFYMKKILESLGAKVSCQGGKMTIDCSSICSSVVPAGYGSCLRSSVILLGSLLGRMHQANLPFPGGCTIGCRPIDLHVSALEAMGAGIVCRSGRLSAVCNRLCGAYIRFAKVSVGATENALLAAAAAEGTTILENCAREPEIGHLCRMMYGMGVSIEGIGSGRLKVRGGSELHDSSYVVPPDRIVAGTYMGAGAATRGVVELLDAPVTEMEAILEVYQKMGGQYHLRGGKLVADSRQIRYPVLELETAEYPGFPTDMQSVWMSVLSTIEGVSLLREQIFEERFKIVSQLNRMGARISVKGRDARICGGRLTGHPVYAEELRGGAALVTAALAARGETVIYNPGYILRGYEDFCGHLVALGGNITIE